MSVVIETTLGDITVDLFLKERPRACLNFLKLCKMKYYNYNLFHTVSRNFIAQTGDPTGSRTGGESVFGVLDGPTKRYFEPETIPRIKHTTTGLISFVGSDENGSIGSQFFITLAPDLTYLDGKHCVFGEAVEGFDVLELLNEAICDSDNRPYQDIRITHTVILDDPFPDPKRLSAPSRSPSPSAERLRGGRIAPDEEIDETAGKSLEEINEIIADREAKARATILEMVGDIPDADMAPPENVLFVCKLNPVTTDDDLEIIFSRFGKIKSCEVIRDKKSGDSLQYAFVEFEEQKSCEDAYFKMDNVLVDDRRIHVDFSQSVAKVKWLGKGKGVRHFDDNGKRSKGGDNDIGQGNYKRLRSQNLGNRRENHKDSSRNERYKSNDGYRDKYRDNSRDVRRRSKERSPQDRHRNREDKASYRRERSRSRDRESERYDRRNDRNRDRKDIDGDRWKRYDDEYDRRGRERGRYYEKRDDERGNKRREKKKMGGNNSSSDDEDGKGERSKMRDKYDRRDDGRGSKRRKKINDNSTSDDDEDREKKSKSKSKKSKRGDSEGSSDSSGNERRKKKKDKKKKKRKKRKSSSSDSES